MKKRLTLVAIVSVLAFSAGFVIRGMMTAGTTYINLAGIQYGEGNPLTVEDFYRLNEALDAWRGSNSENLKPDAVAVVIPGGGGGVQIRCTHLNKQQVNEVISIVESAISIIEESEVR